LIISLTFAVCGRVVDGLRYYYKKLILTGAIWQAIVTLHFGNRWSYCEFSFNV